MSDPCAWCRSHKCTIWGFRGEGPYDPSLSWRWHGRRDRAGRRGFRHLPGTTKVRSEQAFTTAPANWRNGRRVVVGSTAGAGGIAVFRFDGTNVPYPPGTEGHCTHFYLAVIRDHQELRARAGCDWWRLGGPRGRRESDPLIPTWKGRRSTAKLHARLRLDLPSLHPPHRQAQRNHGNADRGGGDRLRNPGEPIVRGCSKTRSRSCTFALGTN